MPIHGKSAKSGTSSARQRAIEKIEERKRREAAAARKGAGKTKSGTPRRETKLNWQKVQTDAAKVKSGGGNSFLKLEAGENRVRLMMNPGGDSFYTVRRETYLPVGGKNGKGQTVVSPKTDDDGAYCPLCVVADALQKAADKSRKPAWKKKAEEVARRLRPKSVYHSNALIRVGAKWEQGVLSYGPMVFQGIATGMKHLVDDDADEDEFLEEGNIAHPDTGKIIIIERTGAKMQTRYAVTITPKGLPVTDAQLAARYDIDEFKETTGADDIEDALCELWGTDDFDELTSDTIEDLPLPNMNMQQRDSASEDDDDDKPSHRKKKAKPPVSKQTRRKVEEDDEDEDEDEDDEDNEDEPPVRKKTKASAAPTKSKKRAPVEDDEDEDEEDDEDDEDDDDEDVGLEDDMPSCIGNFGKPDKGYRCKGCPHAKLCKDLG